MQYLGGKEKIAQKLVDAIRPYATDCIKILEPFCGGCSMTSKLANLGLPIEASDSHEALITMWKHSQKGWVPPDYLSKDNYEKYKKLKDPKDPMTAFVGFGCSFGGKYFGGYAKDNGSRKYCLNAKNSIAKKIKTMSNVTFLHKKFQEINLEKITQCLIYCDPPYFGTTRYTDNINHDEFWDWIRKASQNNIVLVSSYEAPEDFEPVWQIEKRLGLRDVNGSQQVSIEKLFKYKG